MISILYLKELQGCKGSYADYYYGAFSERSVRHMISQEAGTLSRYPFSPGRLFRWACFMQG
jgi:hypothetical protein